MADTNENAAVTEIAGPPDRLRMRVEVPTLTPSEVYARWTDPELVVKWWPVRAEAEVRPGGWYRFEWPEQGWTLRGQYTAVERDRRLGFSWTWDHAPTVVKEVLVAFDPSPGGTAVTVDHGPYGGSAADAELRESHRAGWLHFLGRLAEE